MSTLHLMTSETAMPYEVDQAWNAMAAVTDLVTELGRDVVGDVTITATPGDIRPTVELFLVGDETDAWELRLKLGIDRFARALYIEPGSGDLYRAAYGTHGCDCSGRIDVRLLTLTDPDRDAELLTDDARPGELQHGIPYREGDPA